MNKQPPEPRRELRTQEIEADLAVVGGGLAGTCCAVTAARAGLRVVLVQDRPVLGGNASSEVRLWVLGATSHMGNNNRWAREGGVVDELLVENTYRNPEGNPLIFDTILLERVTSEPNITLLLNTAVYEVEKAEGDRVASVTGFCSQNSTRYVLSAPLFCDASGDGIVGFLSGAAFRMGAESSEELGEKFAPTQEYGELLGHSLYFYSKDTGRPVRFVPPAYALDDITKIPRFRAFNTKDFGCRLWWIEYGGRLDTVHETETIKWELWKVVYGVWDYIKNSGKFPEAETLTLEWVGHIPGKRESRRFEGDYLLRQQDLVEQRHFDDAVAFGGWSIDLHPADGIFSEKPGCNQWHSKGTYQIPYRCFYSRNIPNLFLAGRIISASHVAFGSTRVMATCGHGAQAVGMAAALCHRYRLLPAGVSQDPARVKELQRDLLRAGQHIPGFRLEDPEDLAPRAAITASSRLRLAALPPDGPLLPLNESWAMLLPVAAGRMPQVTFTLDAAAETTLRAELRACSRPDNYTPDVTLAERSLRLAPGADQLVSLSFDAEIDADRYVFVCLLRNEHVSVRCSEGRITGVLSVAHRFNPAVARGAVQQPSGDIGVDTFEFWTPRRRPGGQNLALTLDPPLDLFGPENVVNGVQRPTHRPNAWVADPADPYPTLTLQWKEPQTIGRIELSFDTDFDHPMESVLMGHPEPIMPFCVRRCRIKDAAGTVLAEVDDNHQTRHTVRLSAPIETDRLVLELEHPGPNVPAALFEVRCYPC
jgi:FAD-dependent oxidoreductase family protein